MMMGNDKTRTSISLDQRVAERARASDEDTSPLVNKWLDEYHRNGQRPVMDETRIDQMLAELDEREEEFDATVAAMRETFADIRETLEGARGGADEVDEAMDEVFDELHDRFTEFKPGLKSTDERVDWQRSPRDPENIALQQQAERHGIDPERLTHELEKRDQRDGLVAAEDEQ